MNHKRVQLSNDCGVGLEYPLIKGYDPNMLIKSIEENLNNPKFKDYSMDEVFGKYSMDKDNFIFLWEWMFNGDIESPYKEFDILTDIMNIHYTRIVIDTFSIPYLGQKPETLSSSLKYSLVSDFFNKVYHKNYGLSLNKINRDLRKQWMADKTRYLCLSRKGKTILQLKDIYVSRWVSVSKDAPVIVLSLQLVQYLLNLCHQRNYDAFNRSFGSQTHFVTKNINDL